MESDIENEYGTWCTANRKSGEATDTLQAWKKQTAGTGLVFVYSGKQSKMLKNWKDIFKDIQAMAFQWRDLWHHIASRLVMAGACLYTARELPVYSTLAVTEKYAHLALEQRVTAVALLDGGR
jgi:hypothetical protein